MKKQINDLLLKMQNGEICIGQTANQLLDLFAVSGSLPSDYVLEKMGQDKADNSWVNDNDSDISGNECKASIKQYYIEGFKDGFNYRK